MCLQAFRQPLHLCKSSFRSINTRFETTRGYCLNNGERQRLDRRRRRNVSASEKSLCRVRSNSPSFNEQEPTSSESHDSSISELLILLETIIQKLRTNLEKERKHARDIVHHNRVSDEVESPPTLLIKDKYLALPVYVCFYLTSPVARTVLFFLDIFKARSMRLFFSLPPLVQ